MKTIKGKHVRKVIQKDSGVEIVEHTYVRAEDKTDTDPETGQNRPYPTLPESANPNDPPQST